MKNEYISEPRRRGLLPDPPPLIRYPSLTFAPAKFLQPFRNAHGIYITPGVSGPIGVCKYADICR